VVPALPPVPPAVLPEEPPGALGSGSLPQASAVDKKRATPIARVVAEVVSLLMIVMGSLR
jgi:hypothetical protein